MTFRTAAYLFLLAGTALPAVRVEFDPRLPEVGPFPNDFLTVPDATRPNGLRVALPLPDCGGRASDCAEIAQINQLDGFNVNTRLTVKFSGAIDPETLRAGVHFVWLDPVRPPAYMIHSPGRVTPINEVIYDPGSNTAYAKPDEMLETGRRYLIVVTDAVRDTSGAAVEPDAGFEDCIAGRLVASYCGDLATALTRARAALPGRIVGASLYTTTNALAWYTQAEQALRMVAPRFQTRAEGAIVSLRNVTGIAFHQQVGVNGELRPETLPIPAGLIAQLGLDRVGFGSFESLSLAGGPPLRVHFHVFLPGSPMPEGGYRVLLAGHGLGDSRFGMPTAMALATAQGYAVLAMSAFGHGYGPASTLEVARADGSGTSIAAPGRGRDLDRDGRIGAFEGCAIFAPGLPLGFRDCIRQTVVDYRQLVNLIRMGVDLDGDGRVDLSGRDIHYIGQSLGGWYGSLVTAVIPEVSASVLNVPPGSQTMALRHGPGFRAGLGTPLLGNRQPSLLNRGDGFDEDMPLRYEAVRIRSVPGAAAIQELIERAEWVNSSAEPAVFAPHFKQATLGTNPIKRVLIQMAWGDATVANPSTSALVRAANLRERTVLYRHDIARQVVPSLPENPHTFLIPLGGIQQQAIALSAIGQAIEFLLSGRDFVPDANGLVAPIFRRPLFEVPEFLPEGPNLGSR
jgi:hypothetical protein